MAILGAIPNYRKLSSFYIMEKKLLTVLLSVFLTSNAYAKNNKLGLSINNARGSLFGEYGINETWGIQVAPEFGRYYYKGIQENQYIKKIDELIAAISVTGRFYLDPERKFCFFGGAKVGILTEVGIDNDPLTPLHYVVGGIIREFSNGIQLGGDLEWRLTPIFANVSRAWFLPRIHIGYNLAKLFTISFA